MLKPLFKPLLLCMVFSLFYLSIYSQENTKTISQLYKAFDEAYGLNPILYKGAKFYQQHHYKFGHPFWTSENAIAGKVKINGKIYDDLLLKYDIYLDNLLFEFRNDAGATIQIILNTHDVDRFWLGDQEFVKANARGFNRSYLHKQLAGDKITWYFIYNKDYEFDSSNNKKAFGYTKESRKLVLAFQKEYFVITSNKSLLKVLPSNVQLEVKQWLQTHDVKMRKATQKQLLDLHNFITPKL